MQVRVPRQPGWRAGEVTAAEWTPKHWHPGFQGMAPPAHALESSQNSTKVQMCALVEGLHFRLRYAIAFHTVYNASSCCFSLYFIDRELYLSSNQGLSSTARVTIALLTFIWCADGGGGQEKHPGRWGVQSWVGVRGVHHPPGSMHGPAQASCSRVSSSLVFKCWSAIYSACGNPAQNLNI